MPPRRSARVLIVVVGAVRGAVVVVRVRLPRPPQALREAGGGEGGAQWTGNGSIRALPKRKSGLTNTTPPSSFALYRIQNHIVAPMKVAMCWCTGFTCGGTKPTTERVRLVSRRKGARSAALARRSTHRQTPCCRRRGVRHGRQGAGSASPAFGKRASESARTASQHSARPRCNRRYNEFSCSYALAVRGAASVAWRAAGIHGGI